MLLVLDVGNTNIVMGLFDKDRLAYQWRVKTDREKTEDEYAMLVQSLFDYHELDFSLIDDLIISSVVPPIMYALERMGEKYFKRKPIIVGKTPVHEYLKMNYPTPNEIGADRVVNAVGAIKSYGAPLIIIDFGTATTYCYIDESESYCGGAITPGIKISIDALYNRAAKLPKVEITHPERVIGKSTVNAMQSGLYYGYVGQVDELVRRFKKESGCNPKVIATGGLAELIADESEMIDVVDHALTLKGLKEIYHNVK
ncbi:type III pantothenate kinase [Pelagirhabdus alkalitolerans]|uniref:type III pantothenate kinase n=1 Tax=Pelagirhabdus alkalitolerans TaxID=1612202 RepID=UPI000B88B1E9|nr:type III pantothenate kinase [Pelagirhabdus alkalitolerans]